MKRPRSYGDDLENEAMDKEWNNGSRRDGDATKIRSLKGLDSASASASGSPSASASASAGACAPYKKSSSAAYRASSVAPDRKRGGTDHDADSAFDRRDSSYGRVSRRDRGFDRSRDASSAYTEGGGSSRFRRSSGSFSSKRDNAGFDGGSGGYESSRFKGFKSDRDGRSSSRWKRSRSRDVDDDCHRHRSSNSRSESVTASSPPTSQRSSRDDDKAREEKERPPKPKEIGCHSSSSSSEMEEGELEPEAEAEAPATDETLTVAAAAEECTQSQMEQKIGSEATNDAVPTDPKEQSRIEAKTCNAVNGKAIVTDVDDSKNREVVEDTKLQELQRTAVTGNENEKKKDGCSDTNLAPVVADTNTTEDPKTLDEPGTMTEPENSDRGLLPEAVGHENGVDPEATMAVAEEAQDFQDSAAPDTHQNKSPEKGEGTDFVHPEKVVENDDGMDPASDDGKYEADVKQLHQDYSDLPNADTCRVLPLNFFCSTSDIGECQERAGECGEEAVAMSPETTTKAKPDEIVTDTDVVREKGKRLCLSLDSGFWQNTSGKNTEMDMASTLKMHSSSSPCQKKLKKPKLEEDGPLQLSLALPGISLTPASPSTNKMPTSAPAPAPAPALASAAAPTPPSPGRERSTYSAHTTYTRTTSDGFTASMSFSGSHPFMHNPSCSLNQNSVENNEFSVGSHPAFQASSEQLSHSNWNEQLSYSSNGLAASERLKHRKEIPLYQRVFQNGNGQSTQASQAMFSRGQSSNDRDSMGYRAGVPLPTQQGQQSRCSLGNLAKTHNNGLESQAAAAATAALASMLPQQFGSSEGSLGRSSGGDRDKYGNFSREQQWREGISSPAQSAGSRDTRSEQRKQLDREISSKSAKERTVLAQLCQYGIGAEQRGSPASLERVFQDIVSEPVPLISQKFQEMPENFLELLKAFLREWIAANNESYEFSKLQATLQRRSDLNMELLSQCHRLQLEVLVATKTGIHDFLRRHNMETPALVEIFFNLRCRNMACRSALPVDDCDCKICSQKNGFCSACMCLVCSKFDSASNTCSWVGCDICLHWCHTDCGIGMSHIKNGRSIRGAPGTTEMHFHCIACEHSSEMFGFVKEVFRTCAEEWPVETLTRELDCVRRIFQSSEDSRGKQLCRVAEQLLEKLENKCNSLEVCNSFLAFLTECDLKVNGMTGMTSMTTKSPNLTEQVDMINRTPVAIRESVYKVVPSGVEKVGGSDRSQVGLKKYDPEFECKRADTVELPFSRAKNRAEIDELESIVRIKQAEAKMFQGRADDARREAEGLRQIAIAKNEKIEEEYRCKLAKLCLTETKERRRRKHEELQILERAQHDYYSMKVRMEADIKDLLTKMEATSRQVSM